MSLDRVRTPSRPQRLQRLHAHRSQLTTRARPAAMGLMPYAHAIIDGDTVYWVIQPRAAPRRSRRVGLCCRRVPQRKDGAASAGKVRRHGTAGQPRNMHECAALGAKSAGWTGESRNAAAAAARPRGSRGQSCASRCEQLLNDGITPTKRQPGCCAAPAGPTRASCSRRCSDREPPRAPLSHQHWLGGRLDR